MPIPEIDPDKWYCGRKCCCRNGEDYLPPMTCDKACCPRRIPFFHTVQPTLVKQTPDTCEHYVAESSTCKKYRGLCFLDVTGWDCDDYTRTTNTNNSNTPKQQCD